jgi:ABC-2 type transport system ATP-binding protein
MRVDIDGLGKTYDGRSWAVRDVDLSIPPGVIFGLIGPNGAGKTTTLRMVATVMEPSEGSIALDGRDVETDRLELRRKIGFLGDGNPLYKDMTPADYLRFFGQCYGMSGRDLETAIAEQLATFRLERKRDTTCGSLSKGMRQRLLIARCLLHRPGLLILDEPADGLDPAGRKELREFLASIRDSGVTILISSHILRELDDLCDQVAILQRGEIVVCGEVGDIIDRYEVSRFVYEIRTLSGAEAATEVLRRHRALVEGTSVVDGLETITIQVQGGEKLMAEILADLVAAGVQIVTCSRQRSRLEDVYSRISEDHVN